MNQQQNPWDHLVDLMDGDAVADVRQFLETLPPFEIARTLSRLSDRNQERLLEIIGPEESAELLDDLSDVQVGEIIEELHPALAAAIVEEMGSADRADVLAELDTQDSNAILAEMPPREARRTRELMLYAPDTAGGVMITEYVAFADNATVADVVDELRAHGEKYYDFEIQYVYIVDAEDRLTGVLRLRDLLMSRPTQRISGIAITDPTHVRVDTPIEQLKHLFDEHKFVGVPVVDHRDQLVGVVRRAAVEAAIGHRATETFLAMSGLIGEDELRTMPMLYRSRRRLAWLSLNIGLNILAASVIAIYQETLSAVIALAVFLPIISDMSGCSGNQAVAVSIRELTLGLLRPYEFMRVVLKEGALGIINGTVLGILLGVAAFLWKGNVYLGMVVGAAMMLNTILAVLLGGLIPLALRKLNQDPALASGPILTTVTDMMGFLMVLGFATLVLSKLG